MMADKPKAPVEDLPRGRLFGGIAVFVIGHATPLAIPLVAASSLSTGWKTALSGLMVFGIPEIMTLVAVVIMGKAGFNAVKALVLGWLGRTLMPSTVSRTRYSIGLVLFLIPFVVGWISPYLFEIVPELARRRLLIAISGDLCLILGLCLMGGEAWDKLRSLFVYNAQIQFPANPSTEK
jgi:hypothetical protein